jgi:hypothetical protein
MDVPDKIGNEIDYRSYLKQWNDLLQSKSVCRSKGNAGTKKSKSFRLEIQFEGLTDFIIASPVPYYDYDPALTLAEQRSMMGIQIKSEGNDAAVVEEASSGNDQTVTFRDFHLWMTYQECEPCQLSIKSHDDSVQKTLICVVYDFIRRSFWIGRNSFQELREFLSNSSSFSSEYDLHSHLEVYFSKTLAITYPVDHRLPEKRVLQFHPSFDPDVVSFAIPLIPLKREYWEAKKPVPAVRFPIHFMVKSVNFGLSIDNIPCRTAHLDDTIVVFANTSYLHHQREVCRLEMDVFWKHNLMPSWNVMENLFPNTNLLLTFAVSLLRSYFEQPLFRHEAIPLQKELKIEYPWFPSVLTMTFVPEKRQLTLEDEFVGNSRKRVKEELPLPTIQDHIDWVNREIWIPVIQTMVAGTKSAEVFAIKPKGNFPPPSSIWSTGFLGKLFRMGFGEEEEGEEEQMEEEEQPLLPLPATLRNVIPNHPLELRLTIHPDQSYQATILQPVDDLWMSRFEQEGESALKDWVARLDAMFQRPSVYSHSMVRLPNDTVQFVLGRVPQDPVQVTVTTTRRDYSAIGYFPSEPQGYPGIEGDVAQATVSNVAAKVQAKTLTLHIDQIGFFTPRLLVIDHELERCYCHVVNNTLELKSFLRPYLKKNQRYGELSPITTNECVETIQFLLERDQHEPSVGAIDTLTCIVQWCEKDQTYFMVFCDTQSLQQYISFTLTYDPNPVPMMNARQTMAKLPFQKVVNQHAVLMLTSQLYRLSKQYQFTSTNLGSSNQYSGVLAMEPASASWIRLAAKKAVRTIPAPSSLIIPDNMVSTRYGGVRRLPRNFTNTLTRNEHMYDYFDAPLVKNTLEMDKSCMIISGFQVDKGVYELSFDFTDDVNLRRQAKPFIQPLFDPLTEFQRVFLVGEEKTMRLYAPKPMFFGLFFRANLCHPDDVVVLNIMGQQPRTELTEDEIHQMLAYYPVAVVVHKIA